MRSVMQFPGRRRNPAQAAPLPDKIEPPVPISERPILTLKRKRGRPRKSEQS